MIVMYGDQNSLFLAITDKDIQTLRQGLTKTFEGQPFLTKNVVLLWAKTKEDLIAQIRAAGVTVTEDMMVERPIPEHDH